MTQTGIDKESKQLLFETIQKLKSDDFAGLIESLLSSAEIKDISRRLMAAKLLIDNHTYEQIVETMGMSESTVGKIHSKTHGSPIINDLFNSK